jgi:threonine dehydrogenase-like Zn-dependent dehydrogenase
MQYPTRAAYTKTYYQFQLRDRVVPEPGPGEVQLQIAACSICGTDLSIAGKTARRWSLFGHEISGVVTAVGAGVTRFVPGDRVALDSSAPCGECEECRAGRPLACLNEQSYWDKYMGFADYMVAPQQQVFPAGDLPPEIACLTEPAAVSIDLAAVADVGADDRVLIIGPGPLGLLAIPECRRRGVERLWMAGRSHSKARMRVAEEYGAELIYVDKQDLSKCDFGRRGVTRILVVAPPTELPLAARIGAPGSIISYIGISWGKKGVIKFDADTFHFKRQQLRASMAKPGTRAAEALDLLQSGTFDPAKVLSGQFALPDIGAAMTENRDDKANAIKLVMVNGACKW